LSGQPQATLESAAHVECQAMMNQRGAMAYCSKCSTQLTDSAKFCNTCGAPADMVASQPQTESDSSHYQIENTINSDVLQNFVGKNFEYFRKNEK
jgi:hypothetical protein